MTFVLKSQLNLIVICTFFWAKTLILLLHSNCRYFFQWSRRSLSLPKNKRMCHNLHWIHKLKMRFYQLAILKCIISKIVWTLGTDRKWWFYQVCWLDSRHLLKTLNTGTRIPQAINKVTYSLWINLVFNLMKNFLKNIFLFGDTLLRFMK